MEQKRSGVGNAAGILYILLLLSEVGRLVLMAIEYPLAHEPRNIPYRLLEILDLCPMVLVIISLFRERRSWLLLTAYVWFVLTFIRGLFQSGIWFYFESVQNIAVNALNTVNVLLLAGMVVFICVPALRDYAGWTGKVWFLPAFLSAFMQAASLVLQYMVYTEGVRYNLPSLVLNMLMLAVSIGWYILFGLWLTEPVRQKKTA